MPTDQNTFGLLSKAYSNARRGYPDELYEYLRNLIGNTNAVTIDLGCGTGISTRELKAHGFEVIGADKEQGMVAEALRETPDIPYVVAGADSIPFESDHFDLCTAFTAFHWFNTELALTEIRRVLKNGGLFFAALKMNHKSEDTEGFRKGYQAIYRKYAGNTFSTLSDHDNREFLAKLFTNLTEKTFYVEERYTVDEMLTLAQSLSLWNLVSDGNRPKMLQELRDFYEQHLIDGMVVRKQEIATVAATKAVA